MEDNEKRKVLLSSEETEKARKFAIDLADDRFETWKKRNRNLEKSTVIENLYRGKCGEIASYNFLKRNGKTVSDVDFKIYDSVKHDADLEIIGSAIQIHVKTCKKNGNSWVFERNARYVKHHTKYDFNCLVQQLDYDLYKIISIRNSGDYDYLPTQMLMSSKCAVYLRMS